MNNDNFMSEGDYIKSLVTESYELMNKLIDFDKDHQTVHSLSIICTNINMVARDIFDIPPHEVAECIYNAVRIVTGEGGDQS